VGYVLFTSLVCTILVSFNIGTSMNSEESEDEDTNTPHTPMPKRGNFVFCNGCIASVSSSVLLQSPTSTRICQAPSVKILSQEKLELGLARNTTEDRAVKPPQSVCGDVSSAFGLSGSVSNSTRLSFSDQASDSLIPIDTSTLSVRLITEAALV